MGVSISKVRLWFTGLEPLLGYRTFISGGHFVWARTYNYTIQENDRVIDRESFKCLRQRVATSALHDSAQRIDPPRCHPNTREAVLQRIFDWMISSGDRQAWLMWLNGAAGAGKTAIAQSTAERCVRENRAVISFFFSRMDPTRNTMDALAATLAYQLILAIPETAEDVLQVIERNPLIFGQSLESQIRKLFIDPLIRAQHIYPGYMLLVILDGLDECLDEALQCSLIKILGKCILGTRNLPVQFLIASRPEPHIDACFKLKEVVDVLVTLPLDDTIQASDDIRRFLQDKFVELKSIHAVKFLLPEDWPASSSIEDITTKSSGQFIYASLAMSYIASPHGHPVHKLQIVEGIRLRNPSSKHPLDYLDALYRHIFSKIDELNKVLDILAFVLLSGEDRVSVIKWAFQLEPGEVEAALADLAAVVTFDTQLEGVQRRIRFLHASLSDFLLDVSRSDEYHISPEKYSTKLACMAFALPPMHYFSVSDTVTAVIRLLEKATPSEELHHALLHFCPEFEAMHLTFEHSLLPLFDILIAVKSLWFYGSSNSDVYRHYLSLFLQYLNCRSVPMSELASGPLLNLGLAWEEPAGGNWCIGRREIIVQTVQEEARFYCHNDLADLRYYLPEIRIVSVTSSQKTFQMFATIRYNHYTLHSIEI